MFLTRLATAEVNFIKLHVKVKHDKIVSFLQALGSYAKGRVIIMVKHPDFLNTNSKTAEAKFSKPYRSVKHK